MKEQGFKHGRRILLLFQEYEKQAGPADLPVLLEVECVTAEQGFNVSID